MANTKSEKLFTEFPPVPTEKWEEVITADLKGADYERKLVWKTGEGFNVRPYYRAENLEGIKFLGSQAGEFPYVRGTHAHNRWRVHQTVSVVCPKEANAEALKILNAGVDSLGFCIASADFSAADLDTLLKDICIEAVEITFCGEKTAHVAELVLAKVEKEGIAKEDVRIAFCIDPLVKGLSSKGDFCSPNGEKCIARIVELIHKTKEYKHVRIVTVAGQTFGNSGSTIVEELAFTLSAGHDYLVRLMDAGAGPSTRPHARLRFSFSRKLQLFHGDRQIPRGTYAVGQHRQELRPGEELRLQDAHPRRDLAVEPDRLRPLCRTCCAARPRPCRPRSPAYIRWK